LVEIEGAKDMGGSDQKLPSRRVERAASETANKPGKMNIPPKRPCVKGKEKVGYNTPAILEVPSKKEVRNAATTKQASDRRTETGSSWE